MVRPPTAAVHGSVTTCTYKAAVASQSVIIEYETGATATSFASQKASVEARYGTASTVSNVGEQAYASTATSDGQSVNAVAAIEGSLQIVVISSSPLYKVETMVSQTLYEVQASAPTTTSPEG